MKPLAPYPAIYICTWMFMLVCVSFWLHAVCSVSGAQDPPNQAWHRTRGSICPVLPLTNFNLSSNLSPLSLHRADRGQTVAPINPHWWQIASRAMPGLLFPTQNLRRLTWNWPSWIGRAGVILGLTHFTTTHWKTHTCGHQHNHSLRFWQHKCGHSHTH